MPDDTPSLPERLLVLAGTFTRHDDALAGLSLNSATAGTLHAYIPAVQRLAHSTLNALDAVNCQFPRRSGAVRDAEVRLKQIAFLTTAAADHLTDAADIIDATRAETPDHDDPYHSYEHALLDARSQLQTARELTALAPEDAAGIAESLATELHDQIRDTPWLASEKRTSLSPVQHAALRATARGRVEVCETDGMQYVSSRELPLPLTTIQSLESRNLLTRHDRPNTPGRQRLHLTTAGRRALAAASATTSQREPAALSTHAAAKPARPTPAPARSR
ncbi:hypothetical protein ACIRQP_34915 [Streptomyces sp. NPDC102274]|uniref:hypothetical protein n=1 Tax=Streptomyces sp. NPDC102274 TaxID=3366151 RepID=UPI00380B3D1C